MMYVIKGIVRGFEDKDAVFVSKITRGGDVINTLIPSKVKLYRKMCDATKDLKIATKEGRHNFKWRIVTKQEIPSSTPQ